MNLGIDGRRALIMGSTSGLGLAVAEALAQEGVTVIVTGRRRGLVDSIAKRLNGQGLSFDLTADLSVSDLVAAAIRDGPVDILVLNSGGPPTGTALGLSVTDVDPALRLLCTRQIELVAALIPPMLDRGWGRIVAVGSSGLQAPLPHLALSNIGRAALAGYLKTLSSEVASKGVTVNMALPGRIATARTEAVDAAAASREAVDLAAVEEKSRNAIPMERYGTPEEFAAVVAFLCSEVASYVTGEQIRCDGGASRAY